MQQHVTDTENLLSLAKNEVVKAEVRLAMATEKVAGAVQDFAIASVHVAMAAKNAVQLGALGASSDASIPIRIATMLPDFIKQEKDTVEEMQGATENLAAMKAEAMLFKKEYDEYKEYETMLENHLKVVIQEYNEVSALYKQSTEAESFGKQFSNSDSSYLKTST